MVRVAVRVRVRVRVGLRVGVRVGIRAGVKVGGIELRLGLLHAPELLLFGCESWVCVARGDARKPGVAVHAAQRGAGRLTRAMIVEPVVIRLGLGLES